MAILRKHLHSLLGGLLGAAFALTALGLYFGWSSGAQPNKPLAPSAAGYTCPMHPEIVSQTAGKCPKCHMNLVQVKRTQTLQSHGDACADGHPGCCSEKTTKALQLPPGHPPVPGYTVAKPAPTEKSGGTQSATHGTGECSDTHASPAPAP